MEITLTAEQIENIEQRAEALNITPEQYKDRIVDAWLESGEEISVTH